MTHNPLPPERLCRRATLDTLPFSSTDELPDLAELPGQQRALEALRFGVAVPHEGYNLFALGPAGSGRESLVRQLLAAQASGRPVPPDCCYVNHFADPSRPRALRVPAGRGRALRDDLAALVDELRSAIPGIFEREDFRARVEEINAEFAGREQSALSALAEEAAAAEVALLRTPNGFVLAPVKDGEAMNPDDVAKLPESERERLGTSINAFQEKLAHILHQVPQWMRERRERLKSLERHYVMTAVGQALDEILERWRDQPAVVAHIEALRQDVVENAAAFRQGLEAPAEAPALPFQAAPDFRRYQVNLAVDNAETAGAPVVFEDLPTHPNLLGRIEHMERFGALVTDFTLIRAGALHRANGGYLVLDAQKLLVQPFAWEGLKRALRARELRPESLARMLSLASTKSLEPEAVPLDVKVVLIGERLLYFLLYEYDPEFRELFKVAADFEDVVDRSAEGEALYARLVATLARRFGLLALDREAVCAVIERAARLAEDAERITARVEPVADLMREADHWARQRGAGRIGAMDVQRAAQERQRRADRLANRTREAILRGTVAIDTAGTEIGQVNGLAVYPLGEFTFAQPTRITATVRLGEGEIVDIERESKLGGNIHSKAMMILGAYLSVRYAEEIPLALQARVAFEQTYGGVEGDSASAAELCALLSALGELPLRQCLAVTGSIDQLGRIQAIGGVNEKIEGFFDLCNARGLSGEQGVIIPAANVPHLMLREDVVAACAGGRFQVYAVEHADDVMELLTGLPAGEPDEEGNLPEGCFAARVMERIGRFFALRREYAGPVVEAASGGAGDEAAEAPQPPAAQL
ncbi:MAG: Lon protease family protein [Betaproteobacteria bacterium]